MCECVCGAERVASARAAAAAMDRSPCLSLSVHSSWINFLIEKKGGEGRKAPAPRLDIKRSCALRGRNKAGKKGRREKARKRRRKEKRQSLPPPPKRSKRRRKTLRRKNEEEENLESKGEKK